MIERTKIRAWADALAKARRRDALSAVVKEPYGRRFRAMARVVAAVTKDMQGTLDNDAIVAGSPLERELLAREKNWGVWRVLEGGFLPLPKATEEEARFEARRRSGASTPREFEARLIPEMLSRLEVQWSDTRGYWERES